MKADDEIPDLFKNITPPPIPESEQGKYIILNFRLGSDWYRVEIPAFHEGFYRNLIAEANKQ